MNGQVEDQSIRDAYAVLELSEHADKEEVEKRYFMLLKKSKAGQEIDIAAINEAYKRIIHYERNKDARLYDEKHYANSKSRKAIDDFWHKYKTHVLLTIAAIFIIAIGLNTFLDKRAEKAALAKLPPSDLDVMFVGDYQQTEQEDLGPAMLSRFPQWQRIKTFVSYNPQDPKDQFDIAAVQKNMLNLITEIPDVYITDRFNFEILASQGAFRNIGDWESIFPAERLVKGKIGESEQEEWFGINASDSPIFKELNLYGSEEKIVALRFDTEKPENSLIFIKTLLGLE